MVLFLNRTKITRQIYERFLIRPEFCTRVGEIIPADSIAIAIVGTRHASQYGLGQAEQFATGLARAGFTIVSGLARGIDTVAHQAALEAGGRTIAVLGSSVTNVYPPENKRLADDITKSGAVISESSLDSKPRAHPSRSEIEL